MKRVVSAGLTIMVCGAIAVGMVSCGGSGGSTSTPSNNEVAADANSSDAAIGVDGEGESPDDIRYRQLESSLGELHLDELVTSDAAYAQEILEGYPVVTLDKVPIEPLFASNEEFLTALKNLDQSSLWEDYERSTAEMIDQINQDPVSWSLHAYNSHGDPLSAEDIANGEAVRNCELDILMVTDGNDNDDDYLHDMSSEHLAGLLTTVLPNSQGCVSKCDGGGFNSYAGVAYRNGVEVHLSTIPDSSANKDGRTLVHVVLHLQTGVEEKYYEYSLHDIEVLSIGDKYTW